MVVRGERIAVVGSGVSGLATAWLLQYHGAEVTLFESEARCGGHTLTDHSSGTPVDLGFQVYNLTTYPHFVSWLEHLGVDSEASDMSFGISVDEGKVEWASHGLNTIFAQRKHLFDLKFLNMVREVLRFGRDAPKVLLDENKEKYRNVTLGQYLDAQGYVLEVEKNICLISTRCAPVLAPGNVDSSSSHMPQQTLPLLACLLAGTASTSATTTLCLCALLCGQCRIRRPSSFQFKCLYASGSTTTSWTSCSGRCGALSRAAARLTLKLCCHASTVYGRALP